MSGQPLDLDQVLAESLLTGPVRHRLSSATGHRVGSGTFRWWSWPAVYPTGSAAPWDMACYGTTRAQVVLGRAGTFLALFVDGELLGFGTPRDAWFVERLQGSAPTAEDLRDAGLDVLDRRLVAAA